MNTNDILLSLIDDYVVRLEDDGYRLADILDALIEYVEVAKDIYYSPSPKNIYGE